MSLPRLGAAQAEHAIRRKLREGLRRTYDSTVSEPLPSDWLKVIDKLEAGRSSPPARRLECPTPTRITGIAPS